MVDTVSSLATSCVDWVRRLLPDQARVSALAGALSAFAGRDEPLTAAGCAEIQASAQEYSRHLILIHDEHGTAVPDVESPGWPPEPAEPIRLRAGQVSSVRRLPSGTAVLRVDGLDDLPVAEPYLRAAFALTAGASRLVVDLRANGGGDPATVALIAGWLLGGGVELSEVIYVGRRKPWTTPSGLPQFDGPVDVLTSADTFSCGEALAYHLQARGRVRVVGESTRGGADHVTPIQLTPTVLGLLPEAYVVDSVTGGNWERIGVIPDLACPADEALDAALLLARVSEDSGKRTSLDEVAAAFGHTRDSLAELPEDD